MKFCTSPLQPLRTKPQKFHRKIFTSFKNSAIWIWFVSVFIQIWSFYIHKKMKNAWWTQTFARQYRRASKPNQIQTQFMRILHKVFLLFRNEFSLEMHVFSLNELHSWIFAYFKVSYYIVCRCNATFAWRIPKKKKKERLDQSR